MPFHSHSSYILLPISNYFPSYSPNVHWVKLRILHQSTPLHNAYPSLRLRLQPLFRFGSKHPSRCHAAGNERNNTPRRNPGRYWELYPHSLSHSEFVLRKEHAPVSCWPCDPSPPRHPMPIDPVRVKQPHAMKDHKNETYLLYSLMTKMAKRYSNHWDANATSHPPG